MVLQVCSIVPQAPTLTLNLTATDPNPNPSGSGQQAWRDSRAGGQRADLPSPPPASKHSNAKPN